MVRHEPAIRCPYFALSGIERELFLDLPAQFAGLRQGMKVLDSNGTLLGHVRDISQRSLLVMEAGSSRVFWVEMARIHAIEGQEVRLRGASPGQPLNAPSTTTA